AALRANPAAVGQRQVLLGNAVRAVDERVAAAACRAAAAVLALAADERDERHQPGGTRPAAEGSGSPVAGRHLAPPPGAATPARDSPAAHSTTCTVPGRVSPVHGGRGESGPRGGADVRRMPGGQTLPVG